MIRNPSSWPHGWFLITRHPTGLVSNVGWTCRSCWPVHVSMIAMLSRHRLAVVTVVWMLLRYRSCSCSYLGLRLGHIILCRRCRLESAEDKGCFSGSGAANGFSYTKKMVSRQTYIITKNSLILHGLGFQLSISASGFLVVDSRMIDHWSLRWPTTTR
jgi:hypothetical protein